MQSPTPSGVQLQPPGKSGAQNYSTVSNGLNMVHRPILLWQPCIVITEIQAAMLTSMLTFTATLYVKADPYVDKHMADPCVDKHMAANC